MRDAVLDYRLGWRWLLPIVAGGRIRLHGFPMEEQAFWQEALQALDFQAGDDRPDMLLVDGVRCDAQAMPSLRDIQTAQVACMVVSRVQANHWRTVLREAYSQVLEYGLLPSGNPRVVVPLTSARNAVTALSLHRPGRWVARFGVMLARTLARFGYLDLLRGRVLLIATKSPGIVPHCAVLAGVPERVGRQVTDYSLYLGTPDDNRKTVVLPLGVELPSVILKVAETPMSCASIHNEVAALSALSGSHISSFVPRLVDVVTSDAGVTLYQEYRPRRRVSARMLDQTVAEFLGQLAMVELETVPLADYLAHVSECMAGTMPGEVLRACRDLHDRLKKLAESGQSLTFTVLMAILRPGIAPGLRRGCLYSIGRQARRGAWPWVTRSITR
jgi:hypothetical protein